MTKVTPAKDAAKRALFKASPSGSNPRDAVNLAKDGKLARDRVSDNVIGMLLVAMFLGYIKIWEGSLFQLPFVAGMKFQSNYPHCGLPFLGPDECIITFNLGKKGLRCLRGNGRGDGNNYKDSKRKSQPQLTLLFSFRNLNRRKTMTDDSFSYGGYLRGYQKAPNFDAWIKELFSDVTRYNYCVFEQLACKDDYDKRTNSRTYEKRLLPPPNFFIDLTKSDNTPSNGTARR